jgi:hypothetical protein
LRRCDVPRPIDEELALMDSRRRKGDREHVLAGADVLEEGHSCESAARNRGVPPERVRAAVKAARGATP